jgi:hypothetical protein
VFFGGFYFLGDLGYMEIIRFFLGNLGYLEIVRFFFGKFRILFFIGIIVISFNYCFSDKKTCCSGGGGGDSVTSEK